MPFCVGGSPSLSGVRACRSVRRTNPPQSYAGPVGGQFSAAVDTRTVRSRSMVLYGGRPACRVPSRVATLVNRRRRPVSRPRRCQGCTVRSQWPWLRPVVRRTDVWGTRSGLVARGSTDGRSGVALALEGVTASPLRDAVTLKRDHSAGVPVRGGPLFEVSHTPLLVVGWGRRGGVCGVFGFEGGD